MLVHYIFSFNVVNTRQSLCLQICTLLFRCFTFPIKVGTQFSNKIIMFTRTDSPKKNFFLFRKFVSSIYHEASLTFKQYMFNIFNLFLFILACAGSVLLHVGFPLLWSMGSGLGGLQ